HVARLALSLFDLTRRYHGLGDGERSILEYASLLHTAGHHVAHIGHHKHTYYLVKNGGLRGFDPLEIELIALVARHHRSGEPKRKLPAFAKLSSEERSKVRVLAILLQVADGLDRSHRGRVRSLTAAHRAGSVTVVCRASGIAELEMWGARKRLDQMAKVLG